MHSLEPSAAASSTLRSPLNRVLLVRLRSIGDTVLMTPVLEALKAWNPDIHVSVVTEPLSAPVLEVHPFVDRLLVVRRTRRFLHDAAERARLILELRAERPDIAFNLHGGTTAAWLCRLSGAKRRVGYPLPNTRFLLTDAAPPPDEIWGKPDIHCVEQQLGLLKFLGIPIPAEPKLSLRVSPSAVEHLRTRRLAWGLSPPYAVVHPAAAFATKQWDTRNFARVIEHLARRGLRSVVMVARHERAVGEAVLSALGEAPDTILVDDLSLAEGMALIAGCSFFLGNDSGPAHIAAGLERPLVVVFGSSNETVWRPWTKSPHRVVRKQLSCVPCAGHVCHAFAEPECIKQVTVNEVIEAIQSQSVFD